MLLLSASVLPGDAQTSEELENIREERRVAQEEAAEQAKLVNAATSEVDELTEALEILLTEVNAAEDRVSNAQRSLDDAELRLEEAKQAVVDQRAEIELLQARLADRAISSFVNQGNEASLFIDSADPTEATRMQRLVEEVTQGEVAVTEQLRIAEENLLLAEQVAEDLEQEAQDFRDEEQAELQLLDEATDAQAVLTAEAENRLDHELTELAAIKDLDAELQGDEQDEIDRLIEIARKAEPPPAPSGGGGGSQPSSPVGAGEIVSVRGIQVHQSVAANVEQMLAAAQAAGVSLSGGGYRSSAGQIEVRKNNCGTSDYAVWEMPASQCRPPTARPGTSQHEKGLAIDFTHNGRLIRSRSNAGYQWLANNASTYGFKNLPSEPWHWSTTGR